MIFLFFRPEEDETLDSPVDIKELLEIMDDDDELLRECFDDFIQDCDGMISTIKDAIKDGVPETLEKTAHAFKGSLKYLAALHAAEFALQLEEMGRNGDISNADNVLILLTEECRRVMNFMKNY